MLYFFLTSFYSLYLGVIFIHSVLLLAFEELLVHQVLCLARDTEKPRQTSYSHLLLGTPLPLHQDKHTFKYSVC